MHDGEAIGRKDIGTERRDGDGSPRCKESLKVEGPEDGRTEPAGGECIEQPVAGHCCEAKEPDAPFREWEGMGSQRAKGGTNSGKYKRVGGSAMSPGCVVGDAEGECDDIGIGEHR